MLLGLPLAFVEFKQVMSSIRAEMKHEEVLIDAVFKKWTHNIEQHRSCETKSRKSLVNIQNQKTLEP